MEPWLNILLTFLVVAPIESFLYHKIGTFTFAFVFKLAKRRAKVTEATAAGPMLDGAHAVSTIAFLEAAEKAAKDQHGRLMSFAHTTSCVLLSYAFVSMQVSNLWDLGPIDPNWFPGLAMLGLALMVLLVRPSDTELIDMLVFWVAFFNSFPAVLINGAFVYVHGPGAARINMIFLVVFLVMPLPVLPAAFDWPCAPSTMPPRRKLQRVLLAVRGSLCLFALLLFPLAFTYDRKGGRLQTAALSLAIGSLLAAAVSGPTVRAIVYRKLAKMGRAARKPAQEAAIIAGMIRGSQGSAAKSFAAAQELFKAVPAAALTAHDLSDNSSSAQLSEKAQAAELGSVAAFVSHSWADSEGEGGLLKHACIQEYAAEHGNATIRGDARCDVWLDKACIDQSNIDASLAGLPIFLAGCGDMLCLVGMTYAERLWCIMEIFVYLRMGGHEDKLLIKCLREGHDLPMLTRALTSFDALRAKTRLDKDRQKLVAVIEGTFGSVQPFNALVRELLFTQTLSSFSHNHTSTRRSLLQSESVAINMQAASDATPVMIERA